MIFVTLTLRLLCKHCPTYDIVLGCSFRVMAMIRLYIFMSVRKGYRYSNLDDDCFQGLCTL